MLKPFLFWPLRDQDRQPLPAPYRDSLYDYRPADSPAAQRATLRQQVADRQQELAMILSAARTTRPTDRDQSSED